MKKTPTQIVLSRLRRRKIFKIAAGYTVIFGFLGIVAFVTGNPLGIAFFVVTFIALRYCYDGGVTFHCEKALSCIAVTCGMFVVVGIFLMPINLGISILAPVMAGLGITWLVHWLGKATIWRDENDSLRARARSVELEAQAGQMKENIEDIEKDTPDLYVMDDDELYKHCRSRGLTSTEQNVAYHEFYEKITKNEIGSKMNYSRSHVHRIRRKMYKKLGMKLKKAG